MTHDTEATGLLADQNGSERRRSLDDQDDVLETKQRAQEEAELVRHLDRRLLPMIVSIFIMNYVDRTAIAAARLRGLEEDLHLTHFQYETAIAVLYLSYCPMQIPSNLLLNKAPSPRLFIGGCVVAWGILSAVTGATRDFKDVLICRFLVGIPEAAFFPGAIYLLSRWYTRKELAFRSAILYTGLLISNAFSSLLAAGVLSTLEGIDGIRAWRWLFFIEGAITIVVGLASMVVLPDYPGNTSWLSASQQRIAQARLAEEAGSADQDGADDTIWTGLMAAVTDVRTVILAWAAFFGIWGLGFSNFFPSIAATMGFDTTTTLLLAAPPWIIASILCLLNARHADATGERFFHICVWYWVTIAGYFLAMSSMNTVTRYVSLFLLAAGYAGFSLVMVWVSNSIPRPPSKRAAAIALVNGFGNLGNIAGSYTWKEQYFGPAYRESCIIGIVALALSTIMALLLRRKLLQLNSELDEQERLASETVQEADDEAVLLAGRLQGVSIAEAVAKKRSFRYLY